MAPNVLAKPNARSLLLLTGAADSLAALAARRDYEVINDFGHAPFYFNCVFLYQLFLSRYNSFNCPVSWLTVLVLKGEPVDDQNCKTFFKLVGGPGSPLVNGGSGIL